MTTDSVVKALAVVGGGAIGGLGMGLFAQLLARAFTTKKLPPWPALTVRILGGLICGWLVYIWLFSGGGSGIGGPGGGYAGSGSDKGGEKTTARIKNENNGEKRNDRTIVSDAEELSIEVLSKHVLKKLGTDESHCYRVQFDDKRQPLTLEDIKRAIEQRRQKEPPLRRIKIVLYKPDSPVKNQDVVRSLESWAKDLKVKGGGEMRVDISELDANAPLK